MSAATSASASASATAPTTDRARATCNACKRTRSELPSDLELKTCSGCRGVGVRYCSPECQKADWPVHKLTCARRPSTSAVSRPTIEPPTLPTPGNPARRLSQVTDNILHHLPPAEAMEALIDAFRLRCEDEYAFAQRNIGIYAQEDPLGPWNEFLDLAQGKPRVLPKWWDARRREECTRIATHGGRDGWAKLEHAVEKDDIQEHYKDNMMPMTLRMLAEMIYGRRVGY